MRLRPTTPQRYLNLAAATTALVGFASALWIYLTAAAAPGPTPGYELEDSKRYLRELERYGGKANLVASEITQWFNGLWHGKRLAFTVLCITVLLAGAFLLAAIASTSELGDETSDPETGGDGDP